MWLIKEQPTTKGEFAVGHFVKVDGFKGYVLDAEGPTLKILATSGATGIQTVDLRVFNVKLLADRSPEGVAMARRDLLHMNIRLSAYALSLLSVAIGFGVGVPLVGVAGLGLVCITAAFLEDVLL
jgi:hypothetical protein